MKDELSVTASLACLELSGEEAERLGVEVVRMLDHFSRMMELDVSTLEPTTHALLKHTRTRPDEVTLTGNPDDLLENVPELEDRFIVIPNVL